MAVRHDLLKKPLKEVDSRAAGEDNHFLAGFGGGLFSKRKRAKKAKEMISKWPQAAKVAPNGIRMPVFRQALYSV